MKKIFLIISIVCGSLPLDAKIDFSNKVKKQMIAGGALFVSASVVYMIYKNSKKASYSYGTIKPGDSAPVNDEFTHGLGEGLDFSDFELGDSDSD